ncbi:MAG: zf-HC2 domain-containing protein [Actinomycetes bacterium]
MSAGAGSLGMGPREHRRWRLAVEAYADDELPPAVRRPLRSHLRECWGCSEDVELMRMVKASLRRQPARVEPLQLARLRRVVQQLSTR